MKSGWIDYSGKKIFFADYSHFTDFEAFKAEVDAVTGITIKEPKKSVLLLVDVTDTIGESEMVNYLKESAGADDENMKKVAVVGVSGYRRIFLRAVIQFTSLDVKTFDTLDAAKDWLVQED